MMKIQPLSSLVFTAVAAGILSMIGGANLTEKANALPVAPQEPQSTLDKFVPETLPAIEAVVAEICTGGVTHTAVFNNENIATSKEATAAMLEENPGYRALLLSFGVKEKLILSGQEVKLRYSVANVYCFNTTGSEYEINTIVPKIQKILDTNHPDLEKLLEVNTETMPLFERINNDLIGFHDYKANIAPYLDGRSS